MQATSITLHRKNYEITIGRITNPDCVVQGWFINGFIGSAEIDNIWCEEELPTFEDADNAILECFRFEFRDKDWV